VHHQDSTGRKAIHNALQVSETRYRRLFETAQDGIHVPVEESGKIIGANTFILDMPGYSRFVAGLVIRRIFGAENHR
jgi:PAS domain S-box-containing protein